jgi:hypothetical protein
MARRFLLPLIAAGFLAGGLAVEASAEGFTTRIEPRPFYGAVVTLEEGVRVIRPLPPERQVIINPNGTPLSLGFNDTNVYEHSSNYNYNSGVGGFSGEPIYSSPFFGNGRGFGRGRGRFGRHFGNRHGFGHGFGHAPVGAGSVR